jgi:hypothetical protein
MNASAVATEPRGGSVKSDAQRPGHVRIGRSIERGETTPYQSGDVMLLTHGLQAPRYCHPRLHN